MTGQPAGLGVDLEFDAGTWTDVSQWLESYSWDIGRTSPGSPPNVGTCSIVLDNTDRRFTPGLTVDVNGNPIAWAGKMRTKIRARIRWAAGTRFIGRLTAIAPQQRNGQNAIVTLTATDQLDRFANAQLLGNIRQIVNNFGVTPTLWFPLNDLAVPVTTGVAAGPTTVTDTTGAYQLTDDSPGAVGLGSDGVDGTSASFTPTGTAAGQEAWVHAVLKNVATPATGLTFAIAFNASNYTGNPSLPPVAVCSIKLPNGGALGFGFLPTGQPLLFVTDTTTRAYNVPYPGTYPYVYDGKWHMAVITLDNAGNVSAYVDGNSPGTTTLAAGYRPSGTGILEVHIGGAAMDSAGGYGGLDGFAQHFLYFGGTVLTAAQAAQFSSAILGFAGETTTQRLTRVMPLAGVPASELALDTSTVQLLDIDQNGMTVQDVINSVTASEGAYSAVYALAGLVRFRGRGFRQTNSSPLFTVDAEADATSAGVSPSMDATTLVNQLTMTASTRAGVAAQVTVNDVASQNANQVHPGSSVDTKLYNFAAELPNVASWLLAQQANPGAYFPGMRFPQLVIDLFTSQNVTPAQAASLDLGQRVRATNLPLTIYPATQADVMVEGIHEAFTITSLTVTLDVSLADAPAAGVWDDTRNAEWADVAAGDWTNATAFTASATAATFATAIETGGTPPVGSFWLIDNEIVQITAYTPNTATTWTLTLARGQAGTVAAPHAAGATVEPWPLMTWAL